MADETHCLLVVSDALMAQDLAEGLAEVFPDILVHRVSNQAEALRHLQDGPMPRLALIDIAEAKLTGSALATVLVGTGAAIALVGRSEARGTYPALLIPYGYGDLMTFLEALRGVLTAR